MFNSKIIKKLACFLISACIFFIPCTSAFAVDQDITEDGVRYQLIGNTLTISGTGRIKKSVIDRLRVRTTTRLVSTIGMDWEGVERPCDSTQYTYGECDSLTIIGDVTGMDSGCFENCPFTEIIINGSILDIPDRAFYWNKPLTWSDRGFEREAPKRSFYGIISRLKFVEGNCQLRSIGELAFAHRKIPENFVIPNSVVSIGRGAFEGLICPNIILPSHLQILQEGTFSDSSVRVLGLGNDLQTINPAALSKCRNLTTFIATPEVMRRFEPGIFDTIIVGAWGGMKRVIEIGIEMGRPQPSTSAYDREHRLNQRPTERESLLPERIENIPPFYLQDPVSGTTSEYATFKEYLRGKFDAEHQKDRAACFLTPLMCCCPVLTHLIYSIVDHCYAK